MADTIQRVLVVTAHPDDSEFGAGGTVAKLVKDGCEVTYVIVTNGNKGSSDRTLTPERLAAIRADEQRTAARTLGVARVEFLGYPDCEVEDTREVRRDVHPRDPPVAARPGDLPEPGADVQPGRLAPRPPDRGRRRARLCVSPRS
jgi:LmbE family N-acetylglucosaminyl deacetylase